MKNWKVYGIYLGLFALILFLGSPDLIGQDKACGSCAGKSQVKADGAMVSAGAPQEKKPCADCPAAGCPDCPAASAGQDKACAGTCDSAAACKGPDMAAWQNCVICSRIFNQPDLMMGCDYSVSPTNDGTVVVMSVKRPELLPKFRAFEAEDKMLCDKMCKMDPKDLDGKLCPSCQAYFSFLRQGAKEERIETPTGTVILMHADCPKLVASMHDYVAKINQEMASFDPSQFMAMADQGAADCCGTCDKTSCETCPATGKQGECTAAQTMPAAMMEEFKNCEICKIMLANPDVMMNIRCNVVYLHNGIALLHTVKDPSKVAAFQNLERRMHAKVDELKKLPHDEAMSKLCGLCRQFADLEGSGASMDWGETPTGTMMVITAADSQVVNKIKAVGQTMEKMVASM